MDSEDIEDRALHHNIRDRTVRLLDMTNKSLGGSAVTVKLGQRFFLATAAHVIPAGHEIQVLIGEGHEQNASEFIARYADESDDIGVLELDEAVAKSIRKEFTEITQIAIRRLDQAKRWPVTLIGYPGQLIEFDTHQTRDVTRNTYTFRKLTFVTESIPTSEWPTMAQFQRRPPDPEFDLFVRFDAKTRVFEQDYSQIDSRDVFSGREGIQLDGMSGGGMWVDYQATDGVWRPQPILVGIDTGAQTVQRWARGTLIRRWLELIVRNYSEFSDLKQKLAAG